MAVLETIKSFFIPGEPAAAEKIKPAPLTNYEIKPLTSTQLKDVVRLNLRCFTAPLVLLLRRR